jgi:hypothetical protein
VEKPEARGPMSRYPSISPRAKRNWAVGLIVFFLIMCGAIAFAQYWAYHVNVPAYEHVKQK